MIRFEKMGEEYFDDILNELSPEDMLVNLRSFQDLFGKESFTVKELLQVTDIYAKAHLAQAIGNIPALIFENLIRLVNQSDENILHALYAIRDELRGVRRGIRDDEG